MAQVFVNYLNSKILGSYHDKCEILELESVNKAYLLQSHINTDKNVQKQNNNLLSKFNFVNLATEPPIEKNYQEFYFQVQLKPSEAIFEFTIILEVNINDNINDKNNFDNLQLNSKSISRINKYGNASSCIFNSNPPLRPYCFCK